MIYSVSYTPGRRRCHCWAPAPAVGPQPQTQSQSSSLGALGYEPQPWSHWPMAVVPGLEPSATSHSPGATGPALWLQAWSPRVRVTALDALLQGIQYFTRKLQALHQSRCKVGFPAHSRGAKGPRLWLQAWSSRETHSRGRLHVI